MIGLALCEMGDALNRKKKIRTGCRVHLSKL